MEFSIENMFIVIGASLAPLILWLIILFILDKIDLVKCKNCERIFKAKHVPPLPGEIKTVHLCTKCEKKLKKGK